MIKQFTPVGLLIVCSILLSSCVKVYHPIAPLTLEYPKAIASEDSALIFSYKSRVLMERGNTTYAKRAYKSDMRLFAFRIYNNLHDTINTSDIHFFNNKKPVLPAENKDAAVAIRQGPGIYLLYTLLSVANVFLIKTEDAKVTGVNFYPVGVIVGPALAIATFTVAVTSNKKFKKEMMAYDMEEKSIPPGTTLYSLVAFEGMGNDDLTLKYIKKPVRGH